MNTRYNTPEIIGNHRIVNQEGDWSCILKCQAHHPVQGCAPVVLQQGVQRSAQMKTQFKFGDTRSDGFRFLCYEKRNGRFREKWCSPGRFDARVQFMRDYWKTYRRKK